MPINKIDVFFCSLIVNRITYFLSAYRSHLSVEQVGRIDSFLKRVRRYGFISFYYDFNGMMECTDIEMFTSIQYEH